MNLDDHKNDLPEPIEEHPLIDCIGDHMPPWVEDIKTGNISIEDFTCLKGLWKRYYECQDYIETFSSDGNMIFGYQTEQEDLIKEMIKIYEKYKPA